MATQDKTINLNSIPQKLNNIFYDAAISAVDRPRVFFTLVAALVDKNNRIGLGNRTPADINLLSEKVQLEILGYEEASFRTVNEQENAALLRIISFVEDNRSAFYDSLQNDDLFLGDCYEAFFSYSGGNDAGQYFTPSHAVDFTIKAAEIIFGCPFEAMDSIYDPACGAAGFLTAAKSHVNGAPLLFCGCDNSHITADIASLNLALRGAQHVRIFKGSSLVKHQDSIVDQVKDEIEPQVVLMNPPFPSKESDFKSFEFITHALDVAAEGAIIAAIVPTSVALKEDRVHIDFRTGTLRRAQLEAVITLPPDLFQPKASVNTVLIVLRKAPAGHDTRHDVVFARCVNDGFVLDRSVKMRVPREAKKNASLDDKRLPREDFAAFLEQWFPTYRQDGTLNIPRQFKAAKLTAKDLESGSEWTPERFLDDKIDRDEILRLARRIQAEYVAADMVREVGGKW